MPTVKITINKFGDAKVDVENGVGQSCLNTTAGVEAALNGTAQPRELKDEFYEVEAQNTVENG